MKDLNQVQNALEEKAKEKQEELQLDVFNEEDASSLLYGVDNNQ